LSDRPLRQRHRRNSTVSMRPLCSRAISKSLPAPISRALGHTTLWPPSPTPARANTAASRKERKPFRRNTGSRRSTSSVLPFVQRKRIEYTPVMATLSTRMAGSTMETRSRLPGVRLAQGGDPVADHPLPLSFRPKVIHAVSYLLNARRVRHPIGQRTQDVGEARAGWMLTDNRFVARDSFVRSRLRFPTIVRCLRDRHGLASVCRCVAQPGSTALD